MKLRYSLIIVLLFFSLRMTAQPPETIYHGSIAWDGYADDKLLGPFDIGFTFNFYGNNYTQFYINSNGQVLFGSGSFESAIAPIPTAAPPNNFIAPFWDDLVIDSYGNILYTTIGAAPNRKLIIQFKNMGFSPYPATMGTFSVILYETNNIIQVQYRLIVLSYSGKAHGGSAAIGLENATGTNGVQYSYHNPNAINTAQAISFSPIAGPSYSVNSNAVYDGVYLTINVSLPEPSIANLISPPPDAVMGTDVTFQWASAPNAASYTLLVGTDPELIDAASYIAGSNLSYNVTGLTLNETYYWGVFSQNATGTTWCEIKRFTTSTLPPLTPVPQTIWVEEPLDYTIKLQYTGGDGSPKTTIVTTLPGHGELYQYNAGVRGSQIISVPATVNDAGMNIIYAATGNTGNGVGNFNFKINDVGGDSPEGTITVNVSPAGIPHVLYFAKSTAVEIQFDIPMADPTDKQNQFTVKNNGTPLVINSASLKAGDPYTIVLTTATPPSGTVLISYAQGDVADFAGGLLLPFTDLPVTLTAQTITFSQSLTKKYSDSPFVLTSSASSGLGITWSSSNLSVATIVSNVATFHDIGTSDITARQAGDATFAPAKYVKTLSVAKGDQTITFNPLTAKTYGDADFSVTAVASSTLPVNFASDNISVATVAGNTVHIVGAGTVVITASQSGNILWNAAPAVPRTLIVNKAAATVTPGSLTTTYNGLPQSATATTSPAGLNVDFTYDGSATPPVNAASYAVIATINDNNYQGTNSGTLIISKTALTATADNKTKIYGQANPLFTIIYSGFAGTDTEGDIATPPVVATTGLQLSDAGEYPITVSGGSDNNYTFSYVDGTLTITKAPLTVTADDKSKTYGDVNPPLTITYSGFVGTDTEVDIATPPVAATDALQGSDAGEYPITVSGGSDNNYTFSYTDGTMTIDKADQTITFSALPNKTYGDADYSLSAVSGSGLPVAFSSGNTAVAAITGNGVHITGAGTTVITALQNGSSNYNAAPDIQQILTVDKAMLTFTADNKTKVYLAAIPELAYTISGFIGTDNEMDLDTPPVVTTNALQSSLSGTYSITVSGGSDNNYTYLYLPGELTITKLLQTIQFGTTPAKLLVGDTYNLEATSSAGLTPLFESLDNSIASISGNIVTGVSKGIVQIRAYHPGDLNYDAAEDFATIEVYSTHKDIMHLFTPNNDGFNDYWELPDLSAWGKCDVKVFSRSGKLIFSDPDYNNLWDGMSNGNPVPEGAYYFIIKTENAGMVKGTLNIVR